MSNELTVKNRVKDHITITLDPEDGTPEKVWKLCYDYRAIARIEQQIGKDIKKIADWTALSSGTDFPAIVWGGLSRFNSEVTLDEVIDTLNPEAQRLLSDKIFDLMFPQVREAFEKMEKEKAAGATASPNAETETTSI
jgi:hypothetical protein